MHRRALFIVTGIVIVIAGGLWAQTTRRAARPRVEPPKAHLIATMSARGHTFVLTRPTPNFALAENESLHPQLSADFSARFEGLLIVKFAGKYALSGDAAIFIDNQQVNDKELDLKRGEHPLRIEYTRKPGAARLQLLWRSEHFTTEPVPTNALGHREEPASLAIYQRMERGRMLVENLNCIGCHTVQSSMTGRAGPDLTGVGSRLSKSWIYKWVENPQQFRHDAAMPILLSKEENRRNVAEYLATLTEPKIAPQAPPKQQQIDEGSFLFDSIGCAACHTDKLNPLNGLGSKYSHASLTAYLEDPVKFDPSGRMPNMLLSREEAGSLAAFLMQSRRDEYEEEAPAGDLRTGEMLVRVIGCLNCHTIKGEDQRPLQPMMAMQVSPLAQVDVMRGCLSDQPRSPVPVYALSPEDRGATRAFLMMFQQRPDVSSAPAYQFRKTTQQLACTQCHSLDEVPVSEGNEHVPPLTGAGLKLQSQWMRQVLLEKARVRPWLSQRMPHYGQVVKQIPEQMVSATGAPALGDVPAPSDDQVKLGQMLLGPSATGYGCTGCHAYKGSEVTVPPESRGPEMTSMARRIRPDFFHRWVRDPARILPATAMPSFFLGKPEEEIQKQIDALWGYVRLGEEMPTPEGLILPDKR